ncbi:hypothetical protein SDC9_86076 [bioreactor metagenome]|uniref:Uncharacterized protein n=1 Tax=bioreactor metagenome TaxID=1076179 RepID=A0A644ZL77_9ZZZZ
MFFKSSEELMPSYLLILQDAKGLFKAAARQRSYNTWVRHAGCSARKAEAKGGRRLALVTSFDRADLQGRAPFPSYRSHIPPIIYFQI